VKTPIPVRWPDRLRASRWQTPDDLMAGSLADIAGRAERLQVMTTPRLSVVVPTRNRPEHLARCLASLAVDLGPDDEVLVVDSDSDDAAAVARVARAAGVALLRCDVRGASRARNAGWRVATASWVAFVDDDMEVGAGWAAALMASAAAPGVGFVAGRTVAPAGATGEAASVTWGRPQELVDRDTRGVVAASNNLLVLRAALERTGGFDERLGPGTWLEAGEDLELLDRVLGAGFTGRYAHEAVACHEQWRSPAERRRLQWAYGKGMGARVASLFWCDRGRALRQAPELLRLGGLLTVVRRARPVTASAELVAVDSGWAGPVLWRLGAFVGLLVGLVRLRPSQRRR
jgi:GT2 family glycosyltransferase